MKLLIITDIMPFQGPWPFGRRGSTGHPRELGLALEKPVLDMWTILPWRRLSNFNCREETVLLEDPAFTRPASAEHQHEKQFSLISWIWFSLNTSSTVFPRVYDVSNLLNWIAKNEFDLKGYFARVPHIWYSSSKSFIKLLDLAWMELNMVAKNNFQTKCVGLHRTWVR